MGVLLPTEDALREHNEARHGLTAAAAAEAVLRQLPLQTGTDWCGHSVDHEHLGSEHGMAPVVPQEQLHAGAQLYAHGVSQYAGTMGHEPRLSHAAAAGVHAS